MCGVPMRHRMVPHAARRPHRVLSCDRAIVLSPCGAPRLLPYGPPPSRPLSFGLLPCVRLHGSLCGTPPEDGGGRGGGRPAMRAIYHGKVDGRGGDARRGNAVNRTTKRKERRTWYFIAYADLLHAGACVHRTGLHPAPPPPMTAVSPHVVAPPASGGDPRPSPPSGLAAHVCASTPLPHRVCVCPPRSSSAPHVHRHHPPVGAIAPGALPASVVVSGISMIAHAPVAFLSQHPTPRSGLD